MVGAFIVIGAKAVGAFRRRRATLLSISATGVGERGEFPGCWSWTPGSRSLSLPLGLICMNLGVLCDIAAILADGYQHKLGSAQPG